MEEDDSERPAGFPVSPGGSLVFCRPARILGNQPTFWPLVNCVFPGCFPHVLKDTVHFLEETLTSKRKIWMPHTTDTVAHSETVFREHMSNSFL